MGCSSSSAANGKKAQLPLETYAEVNFASDFFDHYCLDAKLCQGSFAQIRLLSQPLGVAASDDDVSRCDTRRDECAKVIDLRDKRGRECPVLREIAAREVYIAQKVRHHPNIVKFYEAYKEPGVVFVVMEKCNCRLAEYMGDLPSINEKSLGKLLYQMASSLHHLHSLRVVHRDVTPDNFLIGGSCGHTVKLCDFGLAAVLPDNGKLCAAVGTNAAYTCPEMSEGLSYSESVDIWSLGVIAYVFLYGNFPYMSDDGTKEGMTRAIVKGCPSSFEPIDKKRKPPSQNARAFACALLQRRAELRPSAGEALNLPYMVQVMTGRHMRKMPLPCLRPEFKSACKIGALSLFRFPTKRSDMDDLLSILQFKKLGVKMPQAWTTPQPQTVLEKKHSLVEAGGIDSIPLSKISESSPRSTDCGSPWDSGQSPCSISFGTSSYKRSEASDSPCSVSLATNSHKIGDESISSEFAESSSLSNVKRTATCSSSCNKLASRFSL